MGRLRMLSLGILVCIGVAALFILRSFPLSNNLNIIDTDILIYGSSLGGTSAAIIAAEQGVNVILATGDNTIGGQAVEAGMSAFDDKGKGWENWGLFTDLQKFLWERSENIDGYHSGLGLPQVGRIGSTPDDISSFFLERILKNDRITLLTGHTISNFKKKNGQWYEATLTDVRNNAQKRVRFQYLVDGTMTGRLYEQTQTPFRLGMDTAEETGEKYALPKAVRDAFVSGITLNGKKLGGLGNRVQAVTSPFALLDRGYPGEFIPMPLEGNTCLSPDTSAVSLIAGAQIFHMESDSCQARIVLAPEFSDTYDVYLVQHGTGSVYITVTSPLWAEYPLTRQLNFQTGQEPVSIGSFPLSDESPTTFSIAPVSGDPLVEGILLVQKNLHINPVLLKAPQAWDIPLVVNESPSVYADIYLTGSDFPPHQPPSINGKPPSSFEITSTTIRIPHISLRGKPVLSLPSAIHQTISGIVIIPTAFDLTPLHFSSDTPDKEIQAEALPSSSLLKNTDTLIREWNFTALQDGITIFSIETTDTQWRQLELWQDQPEQMLKSLGFVAQSSTRNPQPVFSATLHKGATYRLRIGLPKGVSSWSPFLWSADAIDSSPALFTDSSTISLTARPPHPEGIYDVWAEGSPPSSASYTLLRPDSPDLNATIPITQNQFQYMGKIFLDESTTLKLRGTGFSILAMPNTNIDTYQWSGTITQTSSRLTLPPLPPGYYRMIVAGESLKPAQIFASLGSGSTLQTLSLPKASAATDRRLVPETLISNGNPITLRFEPSFAQSSLSILLYQEIPNLNDVWSFSMIHHPLLGEKGPAVPLFPFRNIVSGANVLAGKPAGLLPPFLGRDTLGITLVVNPSNDFAGFQAENIDSSEVTENSRLLSAAYAYWMLNDSALTRANLNCDPTSLFCTTKRVYPVIGLFEDKMSMFPPEPYIREGRRLIAKKNITQNDIGVSIQNCDPAGCPEFCRPINAKKQSCVLEQQTPVLFPDALATAGYDIDIHSFVTPTEYFSTTKPLATAMQAQVPSDSLALIRGIWGFPFAKPAEIPLGALLSVENSHLFPASHNIGTSQIANGLYRIHINELAIGQSVGYLLSYCLEHQIEPQTLTGSVLLSFQHNLIENGVLIYPITDAVTADLRKPVQHLIAEGMLVPHVLLAASTYIDTATIDYMVYPKDPINSQDAQILHIFSQDDASKITYRNLVLALHPELENSANEIELHAVAVKDGIVDKQHLALTPELFLASTPSKGDLYRTVYLLKRDEWSRKTAP